VKSQGLLATAVLILISLPAFAAPGAFTLTATPTCDAANFAPAILLQWTPSIGATSYEYIRDDGRTLTLNALTLTAYDSGVVAGGPAHTYFIRASDGGAVMTDSNTVNVAPVAVCAPAPEPFTITGTAICSPGNPQRAMNPAAEVEWAGVRFATSYDVSRNGKVTSNSFHGSVGSFTLDDHLSNGGQITYSVIAKNSVGTTTSNSVVVTVPADICLTAPPVPVLSASTSCSDGKPLVSLDWTWVPDTDAFLIYRNGIPYAVPNYRGYADTNIELGQTYTYNVSTNGLSAPLSNTVTITIPASLCGSVSPPGSFTLLASRECSQPEILTWTAPPNDVLSYSIFRDQLLITSVASGTKTYADESQLQNRSYNYFVRASGAGGVSDSNIVTVDRTLCAVPAPNLAAIGIRSSVLSGRAGDTITVDLEFANVGTAAAMASTARVRIGRQLTMSSSDQVLATIAVPAMGLGDIQRTISVKLPALAAGTYYLFLSLDEEHVSGDGYIGDDVTASHAFQLIDMIAPRRRAVAH
jgi:hypothetical protein